MNFSRYPADKFSVVVFTNLDSEHSDPIKIAHEVAAIYIPELRPASAGGSGPVRPEQTKKARENRGPFDSVFLFAVTSKA